MRGPPFINPHLPPLVLTCVVFMFMWRYNAGRAGCGKLMSVRPVWTLLSVIETFKINLYCVYVHHVLLTCFVVGIGLKLPFPFLLVVFFSFPVLCWWASTVASLFSVKSRTPRIWVLCTISSISANAALVGKLLYTFTEIVEWTFIGEYGRIGLKGSIRWTKLWPGQHTLSLPFFTRLRAPCADAASLTIQTALNDNELVIVNFPTSVWSHKFTSSVVVYTRTWMDECKQQHQWCPRWQTLPSASSDGFR